VNRALVAKRVGGEIVLVLFASLQLRNGDESDSASAETVKISLLHPGGITCVSPFSLFFAAKQKEDLLLASFQTIDSYLLLPRS
jgi:hypothetical protein